MLFVDANVLVYAALRDDPRFTASRRVLESDTELLCISPQIIAEFYSVITNPKRVSPACSADDAIEFVRALLRQE